MHNISFGMNPKNNAVNNDIPMIVRISSSGYDFTNNIGTMNRMKSNIDTVFFLKNDLIILSASSGFVFIVSILLFIR